MWNQRYTRFTLSLLLVLYLCLARGEYFDFLAPFKHLVRPEVRYMCNGILLWLFVHFGFVVGLFVILDTFLQFLGLCYRSSWFAGEALKAWATSLFAATRGQRRVVALGTHAAVETLAEHLVGPIDDSQALTHLDSDARDGSGQCNDLPTDAGLCSSSGMTLLLLDASLGEPAETLPPAMLSPPATPDLGPIATTSASPALEVVSVASTDAVPTAVDATPASPASELLPSSAVSRTTELVNTAPVTPLPEPAAATSVPPTETVPKCVAKKLENELIWLKIELHAQKKEYSKLANVNKTLRKTGTEFQLRACRLQVSLNDAELHMADLKGDLARAQTEAAEKFDALNGKLTVSEEHAQDLKRGLDSATTKVIILEGRLCVRDAELVSSADMRLKDQEKIAQLTRESEDFRAQALRFKLELDTCTAKNAELVSIADMRLKDQEKIAQLTRESEKCRAQALRFKLELDKRTAKDTPQQPRTYTISRQRLLRNEDSPDAKSSELRWSPTTYVHELKRQRVIAMRGVEEVRSTLGLTINELKEALATMTAQRNSVDDQRDKLQDEVDLLNTQNAALEQDVQDAIEAKTIAEEEVERLSALLDDQPVHVRSDAVGHGLKVRLARAATISSRHARALRCIQRKNLDTAATQLASVKDALSTTKADLSTTKADLSTTKADLSTTKAGLKGAVEALNALQRTIDGAYAPLGQVMMERLAARGLHIQRAPKHAEMVTMISEFAVHLANEAPLSSSRSITMADCVVHDQNTVQSTIGALVPMESVQMELASRSFLSDMDTTLVDVDMRMATPYKAAGPVGTQTPYHWMSQQLPVTPSVHSSYMPHLQPSSMSVDQLAQVPFSPQKHQSTPFMNGPRKYSETEADTRFRVLDNFDTPTPKGRLGHLQAISESRSFGSLYDEAEEAQVQEMLFGALGVNQAVALALAT